jgi:hypothetical protein
VVCHPVASSWPRLMPGEASLQDIMREDARHSRAGCRARCGRCGQAEAQAARSEPISLQSASRSAL